jgi:hypothetical protein
MANKLFVSSKGLSKNQLIAVMKYHLSSFNDEEVQINSSTIHKDVLSDDDGATAQTSSKNMYKGLIRWTVDANGHEDKTWPNKWMELSVDELATVIV